MSATAMNSLVGKCRFRRSTGILPVYRDPAVACKSALENILTVLNAWESDFSLVFCLLQQMQHELSVTISCNLGVEFFCHCVILRSLLNVHHFPHFCYRLKWYSWNKIPYVFCLFFELPYKLIPWFVIYLINMQILYCRRNSTSHEYESWLPYLFCLWLGVLGFWSYDSSLTVGQCLLLPRKDNDDSLCGSQCLELLVRS